MDTHELHIWDMTGLYRLKSRCLFLFLHPPGFSTPINLLFCYPLPVANAILMSGPLSCLHKTCNACLFIAADRDVCCRSVCVLPRQVSGGGVIGSCWDAHWVVVGERGGDHHHHAVVPGIHNTLCTVVLLELVNKAPQYPLVTFLEQSRPQIGLVAFYVPPAWPSPDC